jgi:hypothetical protein
MEEKQHAGLLHYCRKTGIFAADLPSWSALQDLNLLFEELESKAASGNLRVDDGFEIALRMEESEINDLVTTLAGGLDEPSCIATRQTDLSATHHFRKLEAAANRFAVSPALQKRIAELLSGRTPHRDSIA